MYRSLNKLLLVVTLLTVISACSTLKKAGKDIGHTAKEVTTDIGHTAKEVTKEVGHATRDIAKKTVKAIKEN